MPHSLMRKTQSIAALGLAAILIITFEVSPAANAAVQQRFVVEEYELFHEVLGPLQHEALPQGDFQRIRSMSNELVARGKAIVKIRVAKWANRIRKFAEARRKFDRALEAFMTAARKDSNPRLGKSFTAVHDSFEELADIAPAAYNLHPPPTVSLSCSSSNPEPGSPLILIASATEPFDASKRRFVWTLSAGKIVNGQGTPRLTIDTAGQAGQKILVTVDVDDGDGHLISQTCEVKVAAREQP